MSSSALMWAPQRAKVCPLCISTEVKEERPENVQEKEGLGLRWGENWRKNECTCTLYFVFFLFFFPFPTCWNLGIFQGGGLTYEAYLCTVPRRKSWWNIKNKAKMAKSDPFVKKSQKSNFQHNHIKKVINSKGKPIVSSLIFPAGYKIMDRHSDLENWSQCPKTQKCPNLYEE